jgi:hypothetical protein
MKNMLERGLIALHKIASSTFNLSKKRLFCALHEMFAIFTYRPKTEMVSISIKAPLSMRLNNVLNFFIFQHLDCTP